MSNRFNYFMATPYLNPSKKVQTIEKVTNELPNDEKTEDVTIKAQQEQPTPQVQQPETVEQPQEGETSVNSTAPTEPVETITFEQ